MPHLRTLARGTLLLGTLGLAMLGANAQAAETWEVLPPTPHLAGPFKTAEVNGVQLAYHIEGKGTPVFLLHGGPANADYLAGQAKVLSAHYQVISVDTRGHGRSNANGLPLSYDAMADDVVGLMKQLGLGKADVVGWSDGGITALDLAMRYPDKVGRIIAFGANTDPTGAFPDADKKPAFGTFITRAADEYKQLSPTPDGFEKLNAALAQMYQQQPNWTPAQLATIKAPTLIVDGDHDEAIKPDHTRYIAKSIPGAKLQFIEGTSHFAFLQKPEVFNKVMLDFLAKR